MTVGELIQLLSRLAPDMSVVVPGYEAGYDDMTNITSVKLERGDREKTEWFFGAHHEDSNGITHILLCGWHNPG